MKRWWLVFVLFAAAGGAAAADDLSIAREALRDGLWGIARAHAEKSGSSESRLVVLESLAGEGRWDEIGKRLVAWKDAKGDGFDYYRAILRGDHAGAMAILKRGGTPEGLAEAKMYEADVLAKEGKLDAAHGVWREIVSATNVGERVLAVASANLMDVALLRRAYAEMKDASLRRMVGLRLGVALLRDGKTSKEGATLIRTIVKDSPDADGSREAFLAVVDAEIAAERWKDAAADFHAAIETWPDVAKLSSVQEGRGIAFVRLGRKDEALEAFRLAGGLATDEEGKATALVREGDVLQELGRSDEAMERYRAVLANHPKTKVATQLQTVVKTRELESRGRNLYREFKFAEAMKAFEEVAKNDPSRRGRMEYFAVLCLYGQGRDDEAEGLARRLSADAHDSAIRLEATLWLAKYLYNRREWKESGRLFAAYAETQPDSASAPEALLWAARAAFADGDPGRAIQLSTEIAERYADSGIRFQALAVQGEALIEQSRFDEAVLVFDRISFSEDVPAEDRARARLHRADALYAMGADNPSRYVAALEAYRDVRFGGELSQSERLVVSFRIARSLDKLKRTDEALDQYYTQVVLAYREGRERGDRFTDEARAVFSRAAFRLADEYESRGRDRQATAILELVVSSDVPAAEEAVRRIDRISSKGRFL